VNPGAGTPGVLKVREVTSHAGNFQKHRGGEEKRGQQRRVEGLEMVPKTPL